MTPSHVPEPPSRRPKSPAEQSAGAVALLEAVPDQDWPARWPEIESADQIDNAKQLLAIVEKYATSALRGKYVARWEQPRD